MKFIQSRIHTTTWQVAIRATAIVAAVYVVAATALLLLVTQHLTDAVDTRLMSALNRVQGGPTDGDIFGEIPRQPRFEAPLAIWEVTSGGQVISPNTDAQLPLAGQQASQPQTVAIGSTDVRVAATTVGDVRIVVGQSLTTVYQARSSLLVAELLIAPLLLLTVFLGALAVGRRVAAPIELARQRQMDFTADASHEMRTPLAVIEAQASLALQNQHDRAWYQDAFRRVEQESVRMRRLVNDLLWLARFDRATAPQADDVELNSLASQAVDRFSTLAESKKQKIECVASTEDCMVHAPAEWLDQLISVLLDNACRYTPEGGDIRVLISAEGKKTGLAVEDSGPGIVPEQRVHIFDRFARASEAPGGSGLGLAIADAIVRATNGQWDLGEAGLGGAKMKVLWARVTR